jgi:hypothetical protein
MSDDGSQWPIIGELDGTETVTIPRAVYEGLLQQALKKPILDPSGRRSNARLARDREVALFVDSCIEQRKTYSSIRAACIARFGAARTPSPQAISRWFRNRL